MLNTSNTFLITILCMGLVTYGGRLAGYWLLQGRPVKGRVKAALDAVPPAILTSVIAPTVFLGRWPEMLAGALTLVAALLRLPLLMVIAIGVGSVALLRLIS